MSLIEQRRRALSAKQAVLRTSLEDWLAHTAGAASRKDPAFEIHYTQTREVDALLSGLRRLLEELVADLDTHDKVLERGAALEETVLAACQVWEFFRTRLAQRLDTGWQAFLRVGDELAWRCYQPVRAFTLAGGPLCKAPPLVYLNSRWSPFTIKRNHEFQAEGVPLPFLRNADFRKALERLPFPVIAVPWYQKSYLPDAVSICHEVGHSIEADFGLTDQIDEAIEKAIEGDDKRCEVWKLRGSELFADLYGCLSVGPAYAIALGSILLTEARSVISEADPAYPSRDGRMRFNAAVLTQIGFPGESADILREWRGAFAASPIDGPSKDDKDIDGLAIHLLGNADAKTQPQDVAPRERGPRGLILPEANGKGEQPLRQVFCFSSAQQRSVNMELRALTEGAAVSSQDIRVLFALAVYASVRPIVGAFDAIETAMRAACKDDRRNAEAALGAVAIEDRQSHLKQAGRALAQELTGLA
jgi:hypothetical protein